MSTARAGLGASQMKKAAAQQMSATTSFAPFSDET